ncbi:ferric transporter ATP-binding subunit [Vibrio metschnikovii]|nr:ferric iron ABC transporter ATP-binding protein [Vibrio metschnikovii CIP 69.14]SUP09446.1 ferric transporter ATP-binding subunit [Vibrio metschnikovii]SUP50461.1 ferric transporter ATP-binding subunit [Vibrio metschnikovii]
MVAEMTPALQISGLTKAFGNQVALHELDLTLERGKVLALLGPSGCGKTTLLRCIAGLLEADAGEIKIQGQCVFGPKTNAAPEHRRLGMVFQDYALWPHMTVAENVAFPLIMQGMKKAEIKSQVEWALDLVGLAHSAEKAPGTLSGGQQQRIALARAVSSKPKLLLMDEPLSNLDKGLRENLAAEIRQLIDRLALTAVFVTHDQLEAFALADEVAVLNQGFLQQLSTPEELYKHPSTAEIATFIDSGSVLEGRIDHQAIHIADQRFQLGFHTHQGPVKLLIPRQAVTLDTKHQARLFGQVVGCAFQGDYYAVQLRLADQQLITFRTQQRVSLNQPLAVSLDLSKLTAWSEQGLALALTTSFSHTLATSGVLAC